MVKVVARLPRYSGIDCADSVKFCAPHPPFDPPECGTQQCHRLPPIDAIDNVG
jgi:hypothetical protein